MIARAWDAGRLGAKLAAMQTIVSTFEEVIDKLVTADKILAEVAINEAPAGPMKGRALREFQRALINIEAGRPDWAIWHFKHAWKYAQLAVYFANR